MSVMTLIDSSKLGDIRKEFRKYKDILEKFKFVQVLMNYLPKTLKKDKNFDRTETVKQILDLFHQIDVTGEEVIHWDSFSAYCIEAGMAAVLRIKPLPDEVYTVLDFDDVYTKGSYISCCTYIPELDRIIVGEYGSLIPKTYIQEGDDIVPSYSLHDNSLYGSCILYEKATDNCPLCVIYMEDIVCVSDSALTLSFWYVPPRNAIKEQRKTLSEPIKARLIASYPVDTSHLHMCFDYQSKRLFAVGGSKVISSYRVLGENPQISLYVEKLPNLVGHQDVVEDIVLVADQNTLISCGLDHQILFWSLLTNKVRDKRVGHTRGIKCLAYCKNTGKHGLLLSGGYDCLLFGWDISGGITEPIFKINHSIGGHFYPIYKISLLYDRKEAVTIDIEGNMKLWNIDMKDTIEVTDRHYQSFGLGDGPRGTPNFIPRDITMTNNNMIIGGGIRLYLFKIVPFVHIVYDPIQIIYNHRSLTAALVFNDKILIISMNTREVLHTYILPEENLSITKVALDHRDRKLLVGTNVGKIFCLSYINGALMKTYEPQKNEISGIVYSGPDLALISISWDRSLYIHNDEINPPKLMRCLKNVQCTEITAVAFDEYSGVVAIGSGFGEIKLYDFQFFNELQMVCQADQNVLIGLAFMKLYPVIISIDIKGNFWAWKAMRKVKWTRFMSKWKIDYPEIPLTEAPYLSSFKLIELDYDHIYLYVGDSLGDIYKWNLAHLVHAFNTPKTNSFPSPRDQPTYSAKRITDVDLFKENLTNPPPLPPSLKSTHENLIFPDFINKWHAHDGAVTSLEYCYDNPSILSCGNDNKAFIWTLEGEKIDILYEYDVNFKSTPYKFHINTEEREKMQNDQANTLLDSMKHSCLSRTYRDSVITTETEDELEDLSDLVKQEENLRILIDTAEKARKREGMKGKRRMSILAQGILGIQSPNGDLAQSRRNLLKKMNTIKKIAKKRGKTHKGILKLDGNWNTNEEVPPITVLDPNDPLNYGPNSINAKRELYTNYYKEMDSFATAKIRCEKRKEDQKHYDVPEFVEETLEERKRRSPPKKNISYIAMNRSSVCKTPLRCPTPPMHHESSGSDDLYEYEITSPMKLSKQIATLRQSSPVLLHNNNSNNNSIIRDRPATSVEIPALKYIPRVASPLCNETRNANRQEQQPLPIQTSSLSTIDEYPSTTTVDTPSSIATPSSLLTPSKPRRSDFIRFGLLKVDSNALLDSSTTTGTAPSTRTNSTILDLTKGHDHFISLPELSKKKKNKRRKKGGKKKKDDDLADITLDTVKIPKVKKPTIQTLWEAIQSIKSKRRKKAFYTHHRTMNTFEEIDEDIEKTKERIKTFGYKMEGRGRISVFRRTSLSARKSTVSDYWRGSLISDGSSSRNSRVSFMCDNDKYDLETLCYIYRKKAYGTVERREAMQLKKAIRDMDMDGSGSISVEDFLSNYNGGALSLQVKQRFQAIFHQNDDILSVGEFVQAMYPKLNKKDTDELTIYLTTKPPDLVKYEELDEVDPEIQEQLKDLFKVYSDGEDTITIQDIYDGLNGVAELYSKGCYGDKWITESEIISYFGHDFNEQQELNVKDFILFMSDVFPLKPSVDAIG